MWCCCLVYLFWGVLLCAFVNACVVCPLWFISLCFMFVNDGVMLIGPFLGAFFFVLVCASVCVLF